MPGEVFWKKLIKSNVSRIFRLESRAGCETIPTIRIHFMYKVITRFMLRCFFGSFCDFVILKGKNGSLNCHKLNPYNNIIDTTFTYVYVCVRKIETLS